MQSLEYRLDFTKTTETTMYSDELRYEVRIFFLFEEFLHLWDFLKVTTLQRQFRGKHYFLIWSIARRKEKAGKLHRLPNMSRVQPL